jgi:transposase
MKHYAGLDVSLEEVSICVVDADGSVIGEGKVATEPAEILSWIEGRVGAVERIVHESGPLSIWLTRELAGRGAPVVCIDARSAHKALSARMNKSDRADAEALAQLARTGWYRAIHIKSEASDRLRILLGARDRMIRIRKDIEGQARGVLKTYPAWKGHPGSEAGQLPRPVQGRRVGQPLPRGDRRVFDRGPRGGLCGGRRDRRRAPGHRPRQ